MVGGGWSLHCHAHTLAHPRHDTHPLVSTKETLYSTWLEYSAYLGALPRSLGVGAGLVASAGFLAGWLAERVRTRQAGCQIFPEPSISSGNALVSYEKMIEAWFLSRSRYQAHTHTHKPALRDQGRRAKKKVMQGTCIPEPQQNTTVAYEVRAIQGPELALVGRTSPPQKENMLWSMHGQQLIVHAAHTHTRMVGERGQGLERVSAILKPPALYPYPIVLPAAPEVDKAGWRAFVPLSPP